MSYTGDSAVVRRRLSCHRDINHSWAHSIAAEISPPPSPPSPPDWKLSLCQSQAAEVHHKQCLTICRLCTTPGGNTAILHVYGLWHWNGPYSVQIGSQQDIRKNFLLKSALSLGKFQISHRRNRIQANVKGKHLNLSWKVMECWKWRN